MQNTEANYLPESTSQQKPKSEVGGSTNLSEGSNEVDQEFKQKQGEKYQFINETSENWPQWSIEQKQKQQEARKQKEIQQMQERVRVLESTNQQFQYMFSRGMSLPFKLKMLQRIDKAKKQQQQKQAKKGFVRGVMDKVKGWFK